MGVKTLPSVSVFAIYQNRSDSKAYGWKRGGGMLLYNCWCFSEKFLESLGVMPGLFSKKDMGKEGGALQQQRIFQKVHNFDY